MTMVAADGQNVQPVEVDEFQIGVAETYDVIVTPRKAGAFALVAESMNRSGMAQATLGFAGRAASGIPAFARSSRLDDGGHGAWRHEP